MANASAAPRTAADLTPLERSIMSWCAGSSEDLVYLIDMTTALADLPRALRGQWFDERLLTPMQRERYREVVKETRRALRRLFRAGCIDIGREDTCAEGLRRHHAEIVAALQRDAGWEAADGGISSADAIARQVRFHQTWADVTDFTAATKELGGAVELVGLTESGRALAAALDEQPEATP